MDLAQLETEWRERQRRYAEWYAPIFEVDEKTRHKRNTDIHYTKEDRYNDRVAIRQQQFAVYNPYVTDRPAIEALIEAYSAGNNEEQAAIRALCRKLFYVKNSLFDYANKCNECIEKSDDGDILRSGLVAMSIDNCSMDFRDTDAALTELAIAAREAGIDIEPHSSFANSISSEKVPGFFSIRSRLEDFHVYALTATSLWDED